MASPFPPFILFGGYPQDEPIREAQLQHGAQLIRNDYPDDQKLEALAVACDRQLQELNAERSNIEAQSAKIRELETEREALERQNHIAWAATRRRNYAKPLQRLCARIGFRLASHRSLSPQGTR